MNNNHSYEYWIRNLKQGDEVAIDYAICTVSRMTKTMIMAKCPNYSGKLELRFNRKTGFEVAKKVTYRGEHIRQLWVVTDHLRQLVSKMKGTQP